MIANGTVTASRFHGTKPAESFSYRRTATQSLPRWSNDGYALAVIPPLKLPYVSGQIQVDNDGDVGYEWHPWPTRTR